MMACKIIITVFRFFYFYINTEFLKILHSVVDDAPQKRTEKQNIFQTQCMEVVVLEKVASPRWTKQSFQTVLEKPSCLSVNTMTELLFGICKNLILQHFEWSSTKGSVVRTVMVLGRECCGALCIGKARAPPRCAGVSEEPLLAQATPVLQQLKEIMAKLDANKGVDKWVAAAPQKGHTLGDVCGVEEIVLIVAVFSSSSCWEQCVPQKDHIVGHLGSKEHNDNSKDHLDGLIPLKVAWLVKGLDNTAVAYAHYN